MAASALDRLNIPKDSITKKGRIMAPSALDRLNILKAADPVKIELSARDSNGQLAELLNYIRHNGNGGHSFVIIVDPDLKENTKRFSWDGDGGDRIEEIKVNGEVLKVRDARGRCHDDKGHLIPCSGGGAQSTLDNRGQRSLSSFGGKPMGAGQSPGSKTPSAATDQTAKPEPEEKPAEQAAGAADEIKIEHGKGKHTFSSKDGKASLQIKTDSKGNLVLDSAKLPRDPASALAVLESAINYAPVHVPDNVLNDPALLGAILNLKAKGSIVAYQGHKGRNYVLLQAKPRDGATNTPASSYRPPTNPPAAPKSATFRAAKTSREAESWAAGNLLDPKEVERWDKWNEGPNHQQIKYINYRGVDVEVANDINRRLHENIKAGLPRPTKIIARPMKKGTTWGARMSTSGELEINSTIAGSYEKLVKQEDANKKLYGAEGKEMLKTIAGHQDQLDGRGKMLLKQLHTHVKYSRGTVGANLSPKEQMATTIDHELAHLFASRYGKDDEAKRKEFHTEMHEMVRATRESDYRYKLSHYGGEDPHPEECYAEAFSAYRLGEKDNLHPLALKFFKKYFPGI